MTREVNVLPVARRRPVWRRGGAFEFITSSAAWRTRATRKRCSSQRFLSSRKRASAFVPVTKRRGCFGSAARRARTCCAVTARGSWGFFASGVAVVTASTAGFFAGTGFAGTAVVEAQPPSSSAANSV